MGKWILPLVLTKEVNATTLLLKILKSLMRMMSMSSIYQNELVCELIDEFLFVSAPRKNEKENLGRKSLKSCENLMRKILLNFYMPKTAHTGRL